MKKINILGIIGLITLWLNSGFAAEAPHELAGFVLGGEFRDYKDRLKPETILPIRYFETLKEAEAKDIEGFKTGLITFGTCTEPWRIVRFKFKYANSSKKFYNQLLKRFKERFGEPGEWRGDPFHIVLAWKWSFIDTENNSISLILQHNTRDQEEKMGNSVKMTMWNLIEKENQCFESKHVESVKKASKSNRKSKRIDWNLFIPR
ncbi:MAG: hypothetical protein JSU83_24500 [Deltaproteobacteria bacterium]|nr:MAG: hypothetical protein JSU83_24500 [Deltaproteobacteria bacterium]